MFWVILKSVKSMTWALVWMICKMEWEEVDSVECQEECSSTSVVCPEVLAAEQEECKSTQMKSSKCSWDNKWEEWMTLASEVLWAVVEEQEQIHSEEWEEHFNNKDGVQEIEPLKEDEEGSISICENIHAV